ncbi:MAG: FAD-binding oxidoreductase, partial [Gammaproteobacteria bacterium]|nr:FAD-binding oxidoreductase [Gammaproteobacteria bacterium]
MSTAVARKRAGGFPSAGPAMVVRPTTPSEISQVLTDPKRYPGPVRPTGSGSSTTRCITANSGTLIDLSEMNRVLRIDADTVTVQPGIALPDLAEILSEEGLELIGGFDLANRSVGGAVCAAGLEASIAGDVGQFAAHAVQLKMVSPGGRKFVINERTKNLMPLMRLSYGLLGVAYEITLRVRPVQGFAVQTARTSFKDLAKLGPRLAGAGSGVKLYLLP